MCRVADVAVPFLLDTGATVTLLSEDYWSKIESSLSLRPWSGPHLVGANGSPLAVLGCADIRLCVGTESFQQEAIVVKSLSVDGILGMDFLTENKCKIDVGERKLQIQSRGIQVSLQEAATSKCVQCPVLHMEETVVIPAWSEMEVMATMNEKPHPLGTWVAEAAVVGKMGLVTARSVVQSTTGRTPIRVINLTQQPTTLHRGTKLAELEEVDECLIAATEPKKVSEDRERISHVSAEKLKCLQELASNAEIDLSEEEKEVFLELLLEYADVFAVSDEDLGHTEQLQHSIHTGDSAPIRQSTRRVPLHRKQEIHDLLQDMLKRKVIQPSASPWASPVVLVPKKDGTTRFCVDYRKLNEVTRKDAYPLPNIEDSLATLAGSKIFSTLDLLSGYWQVGIMEKDREKTAFCTTEGLFEFRVMPFGLCNAPATFQRLMDLVLAGLLWSHCMVYIDDVLVLGRDFSDHVANLQAVFQRFRDANLRLKPKKCSFFRQKVCFLGHIVSSEGVTTDPAKTEKVRTWPCPANTQEVQQFLGFCNYYRKFVKDFATIAKPLYQITERNRKFQWTSACQEAFDCLRIQLSTAPVLAHPDFTRPFLLDTDASDVGMGGVLSQFGDDGQERVVAYGSKLLTKAERNYCVTRKELLAVVTFTDLFRPYLLGKEFTVRTDHGSLTWLRNFKSPTGQLARWLEKLSEYQFNIVHRKGRKHCNADALSRLPCRQCGRIPDATNDVEPDIAYAVMMPSQKEQLYKDQRSDPALGPVIAALEKKQLPLHDDIKGKSLECRRLFQIFDQLCLRDGILYRKYIAANGDISTHQLVVPRALRDKVLTEVHSCPTAGHLGEEKTRGRLKERFYWPGHWNDVHTWCKTCGQCASRKTPVPKARAALQPVKTGHPMQLMAMDILGPLPESTAGNRYVLVIADYFTKWIEAFPMANQEAGTVANLLVDKVFSRFSMPEQLHSDQGSQFESEVIAAICKLLHINKSRTTPYHPQVVERFNRTLLAMLSTTIEEHPFEWEEHLKKVCFAYNTSVHATTGETPFSLMFGRQARLPVDILYQTPSSGSDDIPMYVSKLKTTLTSAYERVRSKMNAEQKRQKDNYDIKVHGSGYKAGDNVWLFNPAIPRGKARKFHQPWTGPYQVLENLSNSTYRLQHLHNRKKTVVHFDQLKLCQPGMRFPSATRTRAPQRDTQESLPPLPGAGVELLDDDSEIPAPPAAPRRYPLRTRRAPDRLEPFVAHS